MNNFIPNLHFNILMSDRNIENWRITAYIFVILSVVIFLIQRTSLALIDNIFEFCIFHIPALVASIIYIRVSRKF